MILIHPGLRLLSFALILGSCTADVGSVSGNAQGGSSGEAGAGNGGRSVSGEASGGTGAGSAGIAPSGGQNAAGGGGEGGGAAGSVAAGGTAGGGVAAGGSAAGELAGGAGANAGGEAGSGGSGGAPPSTACTPARPREAGSKTMSLSSGGMNRSYILHVPPSYNGTEALPLVFDIHGYTSFASEQLQRSKWDKMADKEGFVLIAPDGVNMSWNAGACCGGNKQDDVAFFREMVKKTTAELCIDSKRVYVTGHSNGGAMTYRLACEAADIIAAVAPVCGGMFMSVNPCTPSRPIPVMGIRATGDSTVTIGSADDDVAEWLANDQCDKNLVTMMGVCKTYSSCAGGAEVMDCRPPGNHGFFYANNNTFLVPDQAWPFLKKHRLP